MPTATLDIGLSCGYGYVFKQHQLYPISAVRSFNFRRRHIRNQSIFVRNSQQLDCIWELANDTKTVAPAPAWEVGASFVIIGISSLLLIRRGLEQAGFISSIDKSSKKQDPLAQLSQLWKALSGAVLTAAISFVFYQCTRAVELNFAERPIPDSFSYRYIVLVFRTLSLVVCYFATFFFVAETGRLTIDTFKVLFNIPIESEIDAEDSEVYELDE